jgi:Tol biopolymer transport system component
MKSLQHFILLFFGVFCLCSCSEVGTTLSYASLLSKVINTPAVEYGIAFTPAGDSCFFVRHEGQWGRPDNPPASVYLTTFENGGWSDPELAFFSQDSTHEDDVFVSPDGNAIYFVSNRLYPGKPGEGTRYLAGRESQCRQLGRSLSPAG